MLKIYTLIWLIVLAGLSFEYYNLNRNPNKSVLTKLQQKNIIKKDLMLSPEPGRPISLYLGWTGMSVMILTNLYIARKRWSLLKGLGTMGGWLDFHIFCGLLGPTLIVFHCNFKVGGLVAISFWSMMISFASGVVGRYFYVNLIGEQQLANKISDKIWERFLKYTTRINLKPDDQRVLAVQKYALSYVGTSPDGAGSGLLEILFTSLIGDIRLLLGNPPTLPGLPSKTRIILTEYAIQRRRARHLAPFQKLMGYWHAFHLPFAVFMYVVAVIHIAAALLFGVNK